jgi:glycosyltransferase involved in cell wall biosynthesis
MKKTIAILTNFKEFVPGYSLTGIVKDQAKMLSRYGHKVLLYVSKGYHGEDIPGDFEIVKKIPDAHLIDYRKKSALTEEHAKIAEETGRVLAGEFEEGKVDICFTHDFVFTGWNLPFGLGVQQASKRYQKVHWLHWIHSVPTAWFDWWKHADYGPKHRLVFPNSLTRRQVADQFHCRAEDIRIIPHIKDLRTFWDFGEDTCTFIDDYPLTMQAQFVLVYPASSDRLRAKGVQDIIQVMAKIKERKKSIMIIIANQWATGTQPRQDIEQFKKAAKQLGLEYGREFIFTSEWGKKYPQWNYENGLPQKMLRELFLCSNLFIFPTREESFGLVGPEAALCGVLPMFNKSLLCQFEVMGMTGLFADFGSYQNVFKPESPDNYYTGLALILLERMRNNEALAAKTFVRRVYNYDALYKNIYEPIFTECEMW